MKTIALTGGIATGKSTFARMFMELAERAQLFDCDAEVQRLLATPEVVTAIATALGQDLVGASGTLDRDLLRERVFSDPARRHALEGILHPMVRRGCFDAVAEAEASGNVTWFLADVPLLYETGFPLSRDLDVVVACGPITQRRRLLARSGFSDALADRLLAAQLSIAEKVIRADVVLWNGGTPDALRHQTESLLLWLKNSRRSP